MAETVVTDIAADRNSTDAQIVGNLFPGASSRDVERALILMNSNLQKKLSIAEIASRLSCSKAELECLFGIELGVGPSAAYLALRLNHARRLLQTSNLRLGEIASQSGFGSVGRFTREFRHHVGVAPATFRVLALHNVESNRCRVANHQNGQEFRRNRTSEDCKKSDEMT